MTFSEIQYKRIDLEALKAELAALTERLRDAEAFEEAEAAYLAVLQYPSTLRVHPISRSRAVGSSSGS